MKLMRIFALHDQDNPASGRVMEKIGFTYEGTLPNARISKGKIVTDVYRGMTLETWQNRQNRSGRQVKRGIREMLMFTEKRICSL